MQPELSWLGDPEVFRINRLDAHSDHRWYTDRETMEQGDETLFQSLNGRWRFCLSANPAQRPARFYEDSFDLSGFGSIEVPGHIETQGHDHIHYINTMYPWDGHTALRPPQVDMEHNPVGSYVTFFDLNEALLGNRVCISLQGVEQAFYIWLNGSFVGYAEDSFTPSDFDLTPYLRAQGNRLCVEVYKRSSAAWLEDQDFFRFSGIFREVFLYSKPALHLEDIWLQSGLAADNTTGTLTVGLKASDKLNRQPDPISMEVYCHITDQVGRVLYDAALPLATGEDGRLFSNAMEFPQIQPWSNQTPALYHLTLTVIDAMGQLQEVVPYDIGFRRFEKKDGLMLLNGKRILFNGVNRHEWSAERGRSITDGDMYDDMAALRRNNINAVRTSHYPNQTLWYQLCDQSGIYMIDEANLESHGSWQKMGSCEPSWNVPGSDPLWKSCVLDRAQSMFERDKNHTSILLWSCGNESYAGSCIAAMSDYFHSQDPSRLVHYEGVYWNREFDSISDVESRMYAKPEEIRDYLEKKPAKPFIVCEYMHNMGNSIGGMESYIRLAEQYPQYQGGFIWDFKDQALWHTDNCGRRVLGYGGDFGDRPTDYAFSGNGLLFADGTEKPTMQEVRYWYGTAEQRARRDRDNRAKESATQRQLGSERKEYEARVTNAPALTVIEGDVTLGVKGEGFEVLFSYVEGGPVSLVYGGMQWLYRAPKPAFWRGTTENDKGNGFSARSAVWMGADLWSRCTGWQVTKKSGDTVSIRYQYATPTVPEATVEVDYTVDRLGTVQVRAVYHGQQSLPQLPLFGIRFATPQPVGDVQWLGLSGETYPDRKKGADYGMHRETPAPPRYLVPQEYGCHCDTRWVRLGSVNAHAQHTAALELAADGENSFAFSALPYTPQELEAAQHVEELPQTCRTVVSVLGAVRGVGGIDSWGADVEPDYHVDAAQEHTVSFYIKRCP